MNYRLTWRIWLLIFVLLISLFSIFNLDSFTSKGVVVKDLETNSLAFESGLRNGDVITHINSVEINNFGDYSNTITSLFENIDGEVKISIQTTSAQYVYFSESIPEMRVENIPLTNIQTGLDLRGGARALVAPEQNLDSDQLNDLIAVSTERLNVYGISDVSIRPVKDLAGNSYMLIEIAGATPNDLENLISQQGKFEAKIGEEVVFSGGKDITFVCRNDASCSGISVCQNHPASGVFCNYEFTINLRGEAAQRHADITSNLNIDPTNPGYLEKQIDFYIDDVLSNSLFISENLKGQVSTQIQIQGSGSGSDQQSAIEDAQESMKQMQTILITGSLPYKLSIEKLDTVSPVLGDKFVHTILLTAVIALVAVSLVVFLRYKKFKASLALLFTSFSELTILLGVAAFINWNLDLPSIVGILVMVGTGIDQQIVILDESLSKRFGNIRDKIKGALFIVMAAYFTTLFSLIPLFWAGAGLLKGFAVTTIIGLTIGVFITRPAFADILKILDSQNVAQ